VAFWRNLPNLRKALIAERSQTSSNKLIYDVGEFFAML
jgi:hypothetical protein